MEAPMADLREMIEAHRVAVLADEAMFDADGNCLAADGQSWETQEAEQAAFIALVDAPCLSFQDVAVKVDYFVDGTIGDRSSLIDYLTEYDEGDGGLTRRLLTSLVVKEDGGGAGSGS